MPRTQYLPDVVVKDGLWVDARAYGAILSRTTLAAAVAAIGTSDVALRITPGTWTISGLDLDLSGVSVIVDPGAILSVGAGLTLTLPVNFKANPSLQCFSGTGTVIFAAATVTFPEWWGIDGVADEVEIQAAIDANAGGLVGLDPAGYTLTSAGVTVSNTGTHLHCPVPGNMSRYTFRTSADITMLTLGGAHSIYATNISCLNTHATPTHPNFLLSDLSKHCVIRNPVSVGGKYALQMGHNSSGVFHNTIENPWFADSTDYLIYMYHNAVSQNRILGGMCAQTVVNHMARLYGNANIIAGVSFENSVGDDYGAFTIHEDGLNVITKCRFETDAHGVLVNNVSGTSYSGSQIFNNYWACLGVRVCVLGGRAFTDNFGYNMAFSGFIIAGNNGSTTVDVQSLAGQAVLSVADTTGFYVGQPVVIDEGNANEEYHIVLTVTSGVSLTLNGNLDHTHAIGVTVTSEGNAYGQVCRPTHDASICEYWAQGVPVMEVDATANTININGVPVLGPQQTGVAPMTNLTAPANLDADTVDVGELADIVGNLITKLRAHGLVTT